MREARVATPRERAALYSALFLTDKGEPRKRLITAALDKAHPGLRERLEREQARVFALRDTRRAAETLARTMALMRVAERILHHYETLKHRHGVLDFEDLVARTRDLLAHSDAGWIMYRLDAGIDHILVDEAQDTSPAQWDILRALAREFSVGAGQRDVVRTFFAVGDEKQSIFSFQGAEPRMFDDSKRHFARRVAGGKGEFRAVELKMSFRSAPGILQSVDTVFAVEAHRKGLSSDTAAPSHEAWKADLPSLVEMWDPVAPVATDEKRDWKLPVDVDDPHDPPVVLARRIAAMVKGWLAGGSGERVHDEKLHAARPINAGDVMILVRRRSPFFTAVIRALKEEGVPVAGADRLKFSDHIAVMDLIVLGQASLLPDDDLALATVLKTPLVGLGDEDLLVLAPGRTGTLAQALAQSGEPRHRAAHEKLLRWRARAATATPFDFYAQVLGAEGGRADFIARLGAEAGDVIDEFLRLALAHERLDAATMHGFLATLAGTDIEIKRDMEAAGDRVRVMTVHAAKGLEAKIVLLPDTCGMPSPTHDPAIFDVGTAEAPVFAWSAKKADDCAAVGRRRERWRDAQEDEYRRLLYVALTRAEERLYVMGYHGRNEPKEGSWFSMVRNALAPTCELVPAPWSAEETVLRWQSGTHAADAALNRSDADAETSLPAWLVTPVASAQPDVAALAPSRVRGEAGVPVAEQRVARMARGDAAHALLQYLPDVEIGRRAAAGLHVLDAHPGVAPDARAALVATVERVLALPQLAALFAPDALVEVPVVGTIPVGARTLAIDGRIDRLADTGEVLLLAEFKTGQPSPALHETYVLQLALYAAAIAQTQPGRTLRALLVWIDTLQVSEIDDADRAKALARAAMAPHDPQASQPFTA